MEVTDEIENNPSSCDNEVRPGSDPSTAPGDQVHRDVNRDDDGLNGNRTTIGISDDANNRLKTSELSPGENVRSTIGHQTVNNEEEENDQGNSSLMGLKIEASLAAKVGANETSKDLTQKTESFKDSIDGSQLELGGVALKQEPKDEVN